MNAIVQKEGFGNKGFTVTGSLYFQIKRFSSHSDTIEDMANTTNHPGAKRAPPPFTTAHIAALFLHPFCCCHSNATVN